MQRITTQDDMTSTLLHNISEHKLIRNTWKLKNMRLISLHLYARKEVDLCAAGVLMAIWEILFSFPWLMTGAGKKLDSEYNESCAVTSCVGLSALRLTKCLLMSLPSVWLGWHRQLVSLSSATSPIPFSSPMSQHIQHRARHRIHTPANESLKTSCHAVGTKTPRKPWTGCISVNVQNAHRQDVFDLKTTRRTLRALWSVVV